MCSVNANPTRSRPDAYGSLETGTEPDPVRMRPNCAIVSPRSLLHAVLTVAILGEARSLMVSTFCRFSAFLFYREAFCYFQEANKIISLHFHKDVRCHV